MNECGTEFAPKDAAKTVIDFLSLVCWMGNLSQNGCIGLGKLKSEETRMIVAADLGWIDAT